MASAVQRGVGTHYQIIGHKLYRESSCMFPARFVPNAPGWCIFMIPHGSLTFPEPCSQVQRCGAFHPVVDRPAAGRGVGGKREGLPSSSQLGAADSARLLLQ